MVDEGKGWTKRGTRGGERKAGLGDVGAPGCGRTCESGCGVLDFAQLWAAPPVPKATDWDREHGPVRYGLPVRWDAHWNQAAGEYAYWALRFGGF
jgi:hypothetical protein